MGKAFKLPIVDKEIFLDVARGCRLGGTCYVGIQMTFTFGTDRRRARHDGSVEPLAEGAIVLP